MHLSHKIRHADNDGAGEGAEEEFHSIFCIPWETSFTIIWLLLRRWQLGNDDNANDYSIDKRYRR